MNDPDRPITHQDIMALDDLEAKVERVFSAVRGLREDQLGLVLAIAQYGALWIAADAHILPHVTGAEREVMRRDMIDALLAHSMPAGKAYAQAMIAEGTLHGRVRESPDLPGSWPSR